MPHSLFYYAKESEPLISWLLVIIGWLFVRKDNNDREDRRDIRNLLDAITQDIFEIEKKAHRYYTMEACAETLQLQVEIKRDQDLLDATVGRLKMSSNQFENTAKLVAFRSKLTGNDFETETRPKREFSDRKLMEISLAAKDLIEEMESQYRKYVEESKKLLKIGAFSVSLKR